MSFINHAFPETHAVVEYCKCMIVKLCVIRAVASLTVPGGQEFQFPPFFLKFQSIFLIFPQTLLIFFLILTLRVGDSPTREGPGYATVCNSALMVCSNSLVLANHKQPFIANNYA